MWKHKKYKNLFVGTYQRSFSDRVFTLICGRTVKSYESWQAAKHDGWEKVEKK